MALNRDEREGHADHLIPSSRGGTNEVFNHALACGRCNGDEKRDSDWEAFLEKKAPDQRLREERKVRIAAWIARSSRQRPSAETSRIAEEIIEEAVRRFDDAVLALRQLRKVGGA